MSRDLIFDSPEDDYVYARVVGQGIPVRLTRQAGRQLVEIEKDGEYCDKAVWEDYQKYIAANAPRSAEWPFSAPLYRIENGRFVRG